MIASVMGSIELGRVEPIEKMNLELIDCMCGAFRCVWCKDDRLGMLIVSTIGRPS